MTFENAKLVWELRWDVDWVTAVQFIGNSRRVVAGNRRGNMMEWELPEKLEGDAPDPVRFYPTFFLEKQSDPALAKGSWPLLCFKCMEQALC